jgi:hypothetical protein
MRILRVSLILALVAAIPAMAGTAAITIHPKAAGTVTKLPNFNLLFVQSDSDIQSTCFDTTGENLEFRRGFMEFRLPVPIHVIVRATLRLTESRGVTTFPFPPDVHELSSYPADLVVDETDYDAPTQEVATFETDVNQDPSLSGLTFDVTDAVRQLRGKAIGFRIKLQIDPDAPCVEFQSAGSSFGGLSSLQPSLDLELGHARGSTN